MQVCFIKAKQNKQNVSEHVRHVAVQYLWNVSLQLEQSAAVALLFSSSPGSM
jgi:hypothetical protein